MNTLADYTSPDLLVPELWSRGAAEAIAELCGTLQRAGRLEATEAFYQAVMARERLSPTAFAPGWALPHARSKDLSQLSFAFARCAQPISWPGNNGSSVQMVFLFAVPELQAREYLTLISSVARLSQTQALLDRLVQAGDVQTMFAVLQEVPLQQTRAVLSRVTGERRLAGRS